MTNNISWLKWVSEIQAIAQSGLTYCDNEFDKERYVRLREVIAELAAHCSEHQPNDVANTFSLEKGYATPKLMYVLSLSKMINYC
ncbi:MAG: NUDIX hydrolase N-terminal domain-containing protein [Legionellales bacterium]|nr:NUDIX hydrolase N-terminal domain-containing protein [Legionellales bacterium]